MKKVLLLTNGVQSPYREFAAMFRSRLVATGQFEVEVTHDQERLCDPSGFDALALYILGGELTPAQEQGICSYVRGQRCRFG